MEAEDVTNAASGFPEFTELGKRIEMLRIERGLSKQHLARDAGTSRQQLWRVMTGKSDLTVPLRTRLADVLHVGTLDLVPGRFPATVSGVGYIPSSAPLDIVAYFADPAAIARTLATIPGGDRGRALKRRVLDAVEDAALSMGVALDPAFFDLRRRVLTGEL